MALPKSIPTERTGYLQNLVNSSPVAIANWPAPTKEDQALIGRLVMLCSYIDFNLRRMIEAFDHAKKLPAKWSGKSAKMALGDIETTLETMPDTSPEGAAIFKRIRMVRTYRNMVAHLCIKRIPNEDALVFFTKSAGDYKRALGKVRGTMEIMHAVMDLLHIRLACEEAEQLSQMMGELTHDLETQLAGLAQAN
jgi:hypothetical protein